MSLKLLLIIAGHHQKQPKESRICDYGYFSCRLFPFGILVDIFALSIFQHLNFIIPINIGILFTQINKRRDLLYERYKSNWPIITDEVIVFYVEDDEDDQMIFEDMLQDVAPNAKLRMFKNGFDLLYAFTNPPPSPAIIFVDLNLPGINGFEVIQHIRLSRAFQALPLIVLSTSDAKGNIDQSRLYGANLYIVKSADITHFKQSLYTALSIDWKTTVIAD